MQNYDIKIGDEGFIISNKVVMPYEKRRLDIFEAYERPSYTKIEIFNYWKDWSRYNVVRNFGIETYNGFQFTLGGEIEIDNQVFQIHITKTRQVMWAVI